MREWQRSPVISGAVARWLESPPFEGKNRRRCIPPALELLEAQGDVRVVPLLRATAAMGNRARVIRQLGQSAWKPLQALLKRAEAWPLPRDPSKNERAGCGSSASG